MPDPSVPPPLRVLLTGGNNFIPIFELELSGGGTLTRKSPIRALYVPPGAGTVASTTQINTVYPLSGGGDLSVNRTHSVETGGFLVLSSRTLTTVAPLAGGGNLSGDRTFTVDTAALITSSRTLTTLFPLSGGANLSADRTFTVDTAFLVNTARQVLSVFPLAGGGNLSTDETFSVTTGGFLVLSSRNINTVYPLSGGRNLGADVGLGVDTAFLVISTRAINTTAPLAGGGNLSADRTLTVDTAALVASGRSISTLYPMAGGGDLSANRTFSIDTAFLVTSGRTLSVAGGALAGGGNLGADRTITLGTPVAVGSGGTGQTTLTAFGVLYGSGASALQATAAMNSGVLVVGSGTTVPPFLLGAGSDGQMLVARSSAVGGLVWITTAAAGGGGIVYAPTGGNYLIFATDTSLVNAKILSAGSYLTVTTTAVNTIVSTSAKTIRMPLALMTVAPDSANAFWTVKSGTTVDQSYVAFVDSGLGWATYWGVIPFNLSPVPAWSVWFYSTMEAGNGGNIIFSLSGSVVAAAGSIDTAYTSLVSVGSLLASTANILSISTTTATNFDSTLALTSGNLLMVELTRHANLAADTANAQWNVFSVVLQCNVV